MIKRFAHRFFRWFCHPDYYAEIVGDLEELYQRNVEQGGRMAQWKYFLQVLALFRPSLIRSFPQSYLTHPAMFRHYFNISTRVLLRHRFYSAINILGLAVGMGIALLIYQYIHFELSYDQFHANASQLYRITFTSEGSDKLEKTQATTFPGVGLALKEELSGVKDYTRLIHHEKIMPPAVLSAERASGEVVKFREEKMYYADASFLSMFSFPIIAGENVSALESLNSVVLTASTARKYFGDEDAVGKTLIFDGDRSLTITAVLADLPENSHLQFDLLLSYAILQQEDENNNNDLFSGWRWPAFYTYVQLDEETNPYAVEDKLPVLIDKYTESESPDVQLALQPVTDIHLKSDLVEEISANGSDTMVHFFSIIAIAILLIALINYVNLSTAKAVERAKEVAIRKSIGASRSSLIQQFVLESVLLNLLSLVLGLGFLAFAIPFFNGLLGNEVIVSTLWQEKHIWQIVGITFGACCLVAGLYPAWLISSFQSKTALKGQFTSSKLGLHLRRTLVVFQFAVSVILIAATLVVYQQLSFMLNKELGYQADQLLVVKAPTLIRDMKDVTRKADIFKNTLKEQTSIEEVTVSNEVPGRTLTYTMPVRRSAAQSEENIPCYWISTDEHFLDAFQTKLIAGRNFIPSDASPVSADSENKILLNEKAASLLGFADAKAALQQEVMLWDKTPAEVIGIVENFHQRSLNEDYEPLVFQFPTYYQTLYFALRVNTNQVTQTLSTVELVYDNVFSDNPFEYFFLDDYFNRQYQFEQRLSSIFQLFACLAIFIACLGLFALVSYATTLRVKEISIRKVLGANVRHLMLLLSQEYIILLAVASILAVPAIFFGSKAWLDNYAFRIGLGLEFFLAPASILFVISLLTISYRTYATANTNPAESLRAE